MYNTILRHVKVTVTITHSQCVSVALVIQHAKHMHHIILPSVVKHYGKCVFWFSLQLIVWNISHSGKNSVRSYH